MNGADFWRTRYGDVLGRRLPQFFEDMHRIAVALEDWKQYQSGVQPPPERIRVSLGEPRTPNGYDPGWVECINNVLAEREAGIRITDVDDDLWETFIGPMVDAIEHREGS